MSDIDPEKYRDYLHWLGRSQLDQRLAAKVDLSGVVQTTMVDVHHQQAEWEALPDRARLAWLQRVFANNLLDEVRRFRGQKRDISREQSLEKAIDRSASRLHDWLASDDTSPSGKASANERIVTLANALSTLPPAQATALTLHYLQGHTLKEVADNMDKTEGAVAALIFRGTRALRQRLTDPDSDKT